MSDTLPATATLLYQPVVGLEDCPELLPHLSKYGLWGAAMMLNFQPTATQLLKLLKEKEVFLWRMTAHDAPHKPLGFVIYSVYTQDDELAVYFTKPYNEDQMLEAMSGLTDYVVQKRPEAVYLYTSVSRPMPEGTVEALSFLGFAPCYSSSDFDVKQSFYLERTTYDLYRAQAQEAEAEE